MSPTVCHDGTYIDVDSDNYMVVGGLRPITTNPNIFDENEDRVYEHATNAALAVSIILCILALWLCRTYSIINN